MAARAEEERAGGRAESPAGSVTLGQRGAAAQRTPPTPDVRLYHRAVVVAQQESSGSLRGLVRQLSIDQFENEGRRVMGAESAAKPGARTPIFERHSMDPGSVHKARTRPCLQCHFVCAGPTMECFVMQGSWLHKVVDACSILEGQQMEHAVVKKHEPLPGWPQVVLRELLNPRQWKPSEDRAFFLDAEQIASLCDDAERAFQAEPSVLRLRGTPLPPLPLHGLFTVSLCTGTLCIT